MTSPTMASRWRRNLRQAICHCLRDVEADLVVDPGLRLGQTLLDRLRRCRARLAGRAQLVARQGLLAGHGSPVAPQYLMRGSTTAYAMSATRFATTVATAAISSRPISIG